ncbi:hypothetical protein [Streptomyces luteolus]|uniref:Integral membrane protein n=1 Tax=Streptomyces luteolus TaxID=3043615 RepID=A0ABT6T1L3_9ACTN|nr:hypothetical protein [Streptomyces sp. B-S-A12]MDI3421747.1 hypothetical protein [Streptomyces sp. B-S-A12]
MTKSEVPDGAAPTETEASDNEVAVDMVARVMLAVLTLGFGFAVKLFGPLLAIACDSCQDGVRTMRFAGVIEFLSGYVLLPVTLAAAVAFLIPDGGVKAGAIGLCVLGMLFFVMLALGQVAA